MPKNNKKKSDKKRYQTTRKYDANYERGKRDLSKKTLLPKKLAETSNVWTYSSKDMKPSKKMGMSRSNSSSTSTKNNQTISKTKKKKKNTK